MDESTEGPVRRSRRLRVACGAASFGLIVVACGSVGAAPAQLDARFVDSVRADGRDVPRGPGTDALVAAARKVCERRDHLTGRRRDNALTSRELAAVEQTFAGDPRRFAALALETYCP